MNILHQIKNLIPFNILEQTSKDVPSPVISPQLDKTSATLALIALNVIFGFISDKIINYYNEKAEKELFFKDEETHNKNKFTNTGLFTASMILVNIFALPRLFSATPAKPGLLIASTFAIGRHIYRDYLEKKVLKDSNEYQI